VPITKARRPVAASRNSGDDCPMTRHLATRQWIPAESDQLLKTVAAATTDSPPSEIANNIDELILANSRIHDRECVNLNPATNTMSPRAAAALSAGLGPRTSLGYPGAKYEMGLEAIEQIEMITAQLAARLFAVPFVEFRVPSGAMANLMVFMATTQPGDTIIVPPATIAGHVTHHKPGAAGLYGLEVHEAPIDPDRYSVDIEALAELAERVRPKLITLGSSLNLRHHDVASARVVADNLGATLMFDAAHLSGLIAGKAWPDPLEAGAHVMTMSTYKSLAGPTAGLVMTHLSELAERLEAIAFPGLTANFDVGKTAALAHTLNDWIGYGVAHASKMVSVATALAKALEEHNVALYRAGDVVTEAHAFALDVAKLGGGMAVAQRLRRANLLASAIGLPTGLDDGLRVGTNELVRWGVTENDMTELAALIARALHDDPGSVAAGVSEFRQRFTTIHHTVDSGGS